MIVIKNLHKSYGRTKALRDVDLEIGNGMFGLVGPNGAGKTTLMRILAGLLPPSEGKVEIYGYDVTTRGGKQAVKGLLGYLPQEVGFYPNLSAREFLDYIAILKGIGDPASRRRQVDELLERLRLEGAGDRPLREYSGGMKRRVGIAQALLGDPRLLIVDEPTVGLDPEERVRVRNLLAELAAHRTVILSTHIIEDIGQSCRALAVLHGGRVRFLGSPRELVEQAEGHVWQVTTEGEPPAAGLTVVSTLPLSDGMRYRVLGEPPLSAGATPVTPTLEDSYIWLMQDSGVPVISG